jgi:hypothetical protein
MVKVKACSLGMNVFSLLTLNSESYYSLMRKDKRYPCFNCHLKELADTSLHCPAVSAQLASSHLGVDMLLSDRFRFNSIEPCIRCHSLLS